MVASRLALTLAPPAQRYIPRPDLPRLLAGLAAARAKLPVPSFFTLSIRQRWHIAAVFTLMRAAVTLFV